jgi:hypothetical protein
MRKNDRVRLWRNSRRATGLPIRLRSAVQACNGYDLRARALPHYQFGKLSRYGS